MPPVSLGPPCLAPSGSAVAGDSIRLPVCLQCLVQRPRHCPPIPWQSGWQCSRVVLIYQAPSPCQSLSRARTYATSAEPPHNPERQILPHSLTSASSCNRTWLRRETGLSRTGLGADQHDSIGVHTWGWAARPGRHSEAPWDLLASLREVAAWVFEGNESDWLES